MQIKFTDNDRGYPAGKLADAELHFDDGPLAGLKLIGFTVWENRGSWNNPHRNVTFPARQYAVNGERRSFALLRPIADTTAQDTIKAAILDAYEEHISPRPMNAYRPNKLQTPAPTAEAQGFTVGGAINTRPTPPAVAQAVATWTIAPSTPIAVEELYGDPAPQAIASPAIPASRPAPIVRQAPPRRPCRVSTSTSSVPCIWPGRNARPGQSGGYSNEAEAETNERDDRTPGASRTQ